MEYEKPDSNPFRYCGEYYDRETKTIYLRARSYNPRTGRFTSEDPAKDGGNWYVYCENNPINRIDPYGLDSYVFYSYKGENKVAANAIAKQLEEKYGTETHVINVQSAEEFVGLWNGLGEDGTTIDAVSFISHGHVVSNKEDSDYGKARFGDDFGIGYLQFRNEQSGEDTLLYSQTPSYGIRENYDTIDNIQPKTMEELNFLSCNTANPDFKSNVAQAFYDKNPNIKSVSGYDGGMFIYSGLKLWKRGTEYATDPDTKYNSTFLKFREMGSNPKREKQDKVTLTRGSRVQRGRGGYSPEF